MAYRHLPGSPINARWSSSAEQLRPCALDVAACKLLGLTKNLGQIPGNMNPEDAIRAEMLRRAARLSCSIESEEAWHLIGLFQETQPTTFLRICHRILASFLELTHDYFDQGWPLKSRLLSDAGHNGGSMSRRHQWRSKTLSMALDNIVCDRRGTSTIDPLLLSSYRTTRIQNHVLASPLRRSPCVNCDSPDKSLAHSIKRQRTPNSLSKLRTITARHLFKQILPSKPTNVNHNGEIKLFSTRPEEPMNIGPTITDAPVTSCPGADTWMHPSVLSNLPIVKGILSSGSDTLDCTICRCLIEYMLDTPDVYSTEGLFRIPGNSQRIRDLWIQMQDYFQTPYIRIPQPEPDSHNMCAAVQWDRWDVYNILSCFSPHDLASLLLRTIVTGSRMAPSSALSSASKYPPRHLWSDDFSADSFSTHGLIPTQASDLCFLATRLQYVLNGANSHLPSEDWMPILCQARQLLTYRIVLQLLLPSPERNILLGLLQLFNRVAKANATSRMSAECLARCAAVAVFGPPSVTRTPELSTSGSEENPLRWRIDTLTNLIHMADQLSQLPELVYTVVRNRLRIRFGHSPIQRAPLTTSSVCNLPPDIVPDSNAHQLPKRMRRTNLPLNPDWVPQSIMTGVGSVIENTKTELSSNIIRKTPVRMSLPRSVSALEPGAHLSKPQVNKSRGLSGVEAFQFWRRQKSAAVQQHQRASAHRLSKVQSAIALKHTSHRSREAAS
ncbi:hypothetical protein CLF_102036 [Clonorchis sinensis]|uniref:Rho-GAP domain-containing protein n=1 Tax=Clonorchis sinensis TaxID=79923 RepID=G7Y754_CLOSI|nr:hypothetical protein CLF_102036 [Clonorchis sinensis]